MAQNQLNKQRRNEEKANIFRDSKRRILYPINYTDQAYVLSQDTIGRVLFYDTRIVFALLPIALIFGLTGSNLPLSVFVGMALYGGITFYFEKFFFPKLRILKMKPEDYAYTLSYNVLKIKRQERLIRSLMGIVIFVLIINFVIISYLQGANDLFDVITSGMSILLVSLLLAIELKDALKLTRLIKAQKTDS